MINTKETEKKINELLGIIETLTRKHDIRMRAKNIAHGIEMDMLGLCVEINTKDMIIDHQMDENLRIINKYERWLGIK